MKNINVRNAVIAAIVVWLLAVIAFVASWSFPVMPDPDQQANWVLSIAIVPAALIGAHIYYRKGHKTNGFVLGVLMFLVAMMLDAAITVPLLIMPYGGDHVTFFTDLGFWLIAAEYVVVVALYWKLGGAVHSMRSIKSPDL
jgi:hypothetical protein